MGNTYYPIGEDVCVHTYNNGGCTFCAYKNSKKFVVKNDSIEKKLEHFEDFKEKNTKDVKRKDRINVGPNGSWFLEVDPRIRQSIYDYAKEIGISKIGYEGRATFFNPNKLFNELTIKNKQLYDGEHKKQTRKEMMLVEKAISEIVSGHIVGLGLEVANNEDLIALNKGCTLDDYVYAADRIHSAGADVCANILVKPHRVRDGYLKAFQTAKFAVEELGATDFLLMPAIPMKGTPQYNDWTSGDWNPPSATATSEVFQTLKKQYPNITIQYLDLRVFNFHGRHGRFKRAPGKWTDSEKEKEREGVRAAAQKVF